MAIMLDNKDIVKAFNEVIFMELDEINFSQ